VNTSPQPDSTRPSSSAPGAAPRPFPGRPAKQGLYDPWFEHDACGVGFVVDMKGRKSHKILADALQVLRNLDHRGASGAEVNTGDGAGVTPPLEWSGAPAGTTSYALIMHHTDARGENISYWVLYNIPADVRALPGNVNGVGTPGLNSRGRRAGYAPPHSAGPGARIYVFTVYALSAPPTLGGRASEVTHETLLAAIKEKILASADLSVRYTRFAGADGGQGAGPPRDPNRPPPGDP